MQIHPLSPDSGANLAEELIAGRQNDEPAHSPLQSLLDFVGEKTGLSILIDDYYGIFQAIPALKLPAHCQSHCGALCLFAKSDRVGARDCRINKHAVIRRLKSRSQGMCGMCHLGLTEWVEPLIYRSRCIGALYYGSVVVREQRAKAVARIRKYCRRRKRDAAPYLQLLEEMPQVNMADLEKHRKEIGKLYRVVMGMIEAWDPPVERYKPFNFFDGRRERPLVIRQAMRIIHRSAGEPMNIQMLAERLGCHPSYLGHLFQKTTGEKLMDFIMRVRVHRAQTLLRTGRFGISEVGYMSGFQDASHFSRIFKKIAGVSPGEFEKRERSLQQG